MITGPSAVSVSANGGGQEGAASPLGSALLRARCQAAPPARARCQAELPAPSLPPPFAETLTGEEG